LTQNNLTSAAAQAGLTGPQKAQVDGLSKLLDSHKNLLALPSNVAQQKFSGMTQDQQNAHIAMFGEDKPVEKKTGWLGTAFHYMTTPIKTVIGGTFAALNEVSDFMTRVYRTGAIALDQNVDLAKAFTIANDKGDMVFAPDRINKAKKEFGLNMVNVAMKVASGTPLDKIISEGTEEEKQIARRADLRYSTAQDVADFQNALDQVNAAKYSPGRQLANLILPGSMEGSGFLYKGISGVGDAAYRVFADPTLILGKSKKAYDAGDFLLFNVLGKDKYTYGRNLMASVNNSQRLDSIFKDRGVVNFFDLYGSKLEALRKSRALGDPRASVPIVDELKRIAPEYGDAAIDEFMKAGVKDALTARNYLENIVDVKAIMSGSAARQTPLIPTLNAARKARINTLRTADKIIDIDKVGQKIVNAFYGIGKIQYEDIAAGLTGEVDDLAKLERQVGRLKGADGSVRMSIDQIQGRIDRFARKFTTIPFFRDNRFNVFSADAPTQVYRLARLANSRYHSKLIAEAFTAGNEGQRRQIYEGVWYTLGSIRGVDKSEAGRTFLRNFGSKGIPKAYAPPTIVREIDDTGTEISRIVNPDQLDNGQRSALYPFQLSESISTPSVQDLDRLSARAGIIDNVVGASQQKWADSMTSGWVIGTLAGPKFPVRNALEDLMLHLAVGDSPWGIVKGRILSTRLRAASGEGSLGFINKIVRRKQVNTYNARIKVAADAGDVNAVQTVMAEAIMDSMVGKFLDKEGAELLQEFARYGRLSETMRIVGEGGKNGLRGADQFMAATDDVSRFGEMAAIEYNGVKLKEVYGDRAYAPYSPVASVEARIGWLIQIGRITTDEVGNIAVRNLLDEGKAIDELTAYFKSLSQVERERFQLYSVPGETEQTHAKRVFQATKNLFSKENGDVNEELLAKVRFVDGLGNVKVSSRNLGLDDLPDMQDFALAPKWITGPVLVPVTEGQFASGITEKLWDYMGEANARFSREPLVIYQLINIRKDMRATGFEQRIMDQFTKGLTGEALDLAKQNATRHIVDIAEDLARERVLAFVDNPAVRSQLAMAGRNFARFYRATEDFYRRISRTVKYNPEALTRASLTYEGIAHSGFVQTDDNGDQYFFYPGLNPVYKAVNGVMKAFGVETAFKIPMPVEFGGKLKMITPSMNPDSLFPTFAGPLAAFPIKVLGNLIPQIADLEKSLMGVYAEDQPMINAVLPGHVSRILATLQRDERSSQYASAARKAITYLEAAGYSPKSHFEIINGVKTEVPPSTGELEDYKNKLQSSTMSVLALRALFGFIAPASPQITLKSDMAKWVRDNERTNFKQVFNNLLQNYNGDIDKTTKEWIKLFPEQMPFTLSESERNTAAVVRAVEQSGLWIEENTALLKKYPQGAAFLIPQKGDFDFNAYKLLFAQGLKRNKTFSDFLQEATAAKDLQFYYGQKDIYEADLAATLSDDAKRSVRAQWQTWSDQYKSTRPSLQAELGAGGAARQMERQRAYQDLKNMLADPSVKTQPVTRDALNRMSNEFDSYVNNRNAVTGNGEFEQNYKDLLKQTIKVKLQEIAAKNANAKAAYDVVFSQLIGD
jgi:hypothetical protein